MSLLLFLLIGFSITNALVFLHAFHWLRIFISGMTDWVFSLAIKKRMLHGFRNAYLGRFVRCHACMGFWVGVSLSLLAGGFINKYMGLSFIEVVIGDGFLLSGSNFFIWLVLRKLGAEEL